MAQFMSHVTYTAESWALQVREQANVLERIQPLVANLGGSITSCFYVMGEADLVVITDFPSSEEMTAFYLAAMAGGSVKAITTTPLLSVEQGMAAMQRAQQAGGHYTPPVPSSRAPVA